MEEKHDNKEIPATTDKQDTRDTHRKKYFQSAKRLSDFTLKARDLINDKLLLSEKKLEALQGLLNASGELSSSAYLTDMMLNEDFFWFKEAHCCNVSIRGLTLNNNKLLDKLSILVSVNLATLALLIKEEKLFTLLVKYGMPLVPPLPQLNTEEAKKLSTEGAKIPDALLLSCLVPGLSIKVTQLIINTLESQVLEKQINQLYTLTYIDNGGDSKVRTYPLFAAIMAEKYEVAVLLLLNGADIKQPYDFFNRDNPPCKSQYLSLLKAAHAWELMISLKSPTSIVKLKNLVSTAYLEDANFTLKAFELLVQHFVAQNNVDNIALILKELYPIVKQDSKTLKVFQDIAANFLAVSNKADLSKSFGSREKMMDKITRILRGSSLADSMSLMNASQENMEELLDRNSKESSGLLSVGALVGNSLTDVLNNGGVQSSSFSDNGNPSSPSLVLNIND